MCISVAELGPYQGPNLSLGTPQQSRDNTVTEKNVEKKEIGKASFPLKFMITVKHFFPLFPSI